MFPGKELFSVSPANLEAIEAFDLLLQSVPKARKVKRDGIQFQGFKYFDVNLAGYVGEYVTIRYDPRDLAEVLVYADNSLLCRAVCYELADQVTSLDQVVADRRQKKQKKYSNDNIHPMIEMRDAGSRLSNSAED